MVCVELRLCVFPSCGCVMCVFYCVMLNGLFVLCVCVCGGLGFTVLVWFGCELVCAVVWRVFVCVVCLRFFCF